MLEHDRIDILFRKLCFRLQPFFQKNHFEIATHFMNFDHCQIIAALNNEQTLKELSQVINGALENYCKKPLTERVESSIWKDAILQFDANVLTQMNKSKLENELTLFSNPFTRN